MLYASEIRSLCCLPNSYSRGQEIFSRADNSFLTYSTKKDQKGLLHVLADIQGSGTNIYESELVLDVSDPSYETIEGYRCTCPAYGSYDGLCKHCVSLALFYRSRESERKRQARAAAPVVDPTLSTSAGLASILARYSAVSANVSEGVARGTVRLIPALNQGLYALSGKNWTLSLQIGTSRMYVVKNQATLIHNVLNGRYFHYGKQLAFAHAPEMFDPDSRVLLEIVESEIRRLCPNVDRNPYEGSSSYRDIALQEGSVQKILSLYSGRQLTFGFSEFPIREGDPPLSLTIEPEGSHGANLTVPTLQEAASGFYVFDGTIYHASASFTAEALPFLRAMGAVTGVSKTVRQYLSQRDFQSFCGNLLPVLSPVLPVNVKNLDLTPYQPQRPEFFFYLSMDNSLALVLKPQVSYGAVTYPLMEVREGQYRNAEAEQPVQSLLEKYFTPASSEQLVCSQEDKMYDFLREGFDSLRQFGEVFVEDSAKKAYIAAAPQAKVSVQLTGGLIDLTAEVENLPHEEMVRLLNAYTQKKKFHRLSSGEFLSLEEGSLSVLSELSQTLQLQGQELTHVSIPAFRAQYLNALLTQPGSGIALERTSDFKTLVRRVRDYQDSDYTVPETLHASLRSYQKAGFRWMCALADCGLGGILADDMGLGKTVQAIAYLLTRKGPGLIVCPASLMYNWESELHRFAPSLDVQMILGAAPVRAERIHQEADVYVTSYDLLRRDIAEYAEMHFDSCILDEAQYIRNAGTKLAQTAKQVQADIRFALTGTPIFNRLGDLWSIFDFLLPGYLYTYPQFREQIEMPIAAGQSLLSARLQRLTAPFILRRRKQEVLKELPEKVESIQYVDMSPEQRLLYRAQEQQLRLSLQGADDREFRQKRIEFLAALTRLRQLCCTPELYLEGYHGGSGKVDACMELLGESVDEGHKVLVFSQFTTMLDSLYASAQAQGLSCLMLTGKNSKEQRREMVAAFQAGQADVFFISLKAGGTGLNLTAADRIIHFDPWWNAAAEDQATDRAHRIGQDRTVFVTKLVAKDSVEERIIDLQQKKRALSDSFVDNPEAGNGVFGKDILLELLGSAHSETEL